MNKKFVYQVGNNKKVILWCTANQISSLKYWGGLVLITVEWELIYYTIPYQPTTWIFFLSHWQQWSMFLSVLCWCCPM